MLAVKGILENGMVKPIEPLNFKEPLEVIIVISENESAIINKSDDLDKYFGLWKNKNIGDSLNYVNNLRDKTFERAEE